MTVIQMSQRELSRLRIMVELEDGRLTVAAAATLMGIGQRRVFRLRHAVATAGPAGLASRKRGRPSTSPIFGHGFVPFRGSGINQSGSTGTSSRAPDL